MRESTAPQIATSEAYELGEGPTWDAATGRLLWVDIDGGLVLAGTLDADGTIEVVERISLDETVGAVAPGPDGSWLIAGAERLYVRSADGRLSAGPRLLPEGSGRRLNDGKPDPAGRFVVGTLAFGPSTTEELVVVESPEPRVLDADLTMSNGLAWSADGRAMFSVDTMRRVIYRRRWDAIDGTAGEREVFVQLADGYPDGICLDDAGYLWVAVWGLGEVQRYGPTGELAEVVRVPAPHATSVAFAGPDLETLVITTATSELEPEALARFPASGHLFTMRPGVRGVLQAPWAPS